MANICRLCLSFSIQNMLPLSECNNSVNIVLCLSMHISSNNLFPNQVCVKCVGKITEFNEFRLQVHNNEEILLKQLNLGLESLHKFYDEIKGIKLKNNGVIVQNNEDTKDTGKDLTKGNEVIKQIKLEDDLNTDNNVEYNSEDELPLMEIKDVKYEECKVQENSELTSDLKFKCLTCFERFEGQNILINHYNNVHKCKGKTEISYTLVTEDGKTLYKCDKCDKKYDNKRKINKHTLVHTDDRFHCKICSRTYKTVSEIIRHSRAHYGTKLACSYGCGFATVYSGALKSHESRHGKDYKYKCETCQKSFQVKTWYEQHQNIHRGIKPFVCDICGLAFHMDRYLTSHRSAVHPEASSLDRYVCVQCSKPCGNMKALTLHLKEHGITSSVLCDLCGKTLSNNEQLKIHRRMHLGIKPFPCTTCNKSFSKKCNLTVHMLTHTGERAHACECCGKRYTQRSALSRHIARHHSESQKNCPRCNQSFSTKVQLESHQKLCS